MFTRVYSDDTFVSTQRFASAIPAGQCMNAKQSNEILFRFRLKVSPFPRSPGVSACVSCGAQRPCLGTLLTPHGASVIRLRAPFVGRQVLEEYEATKRLEDEAVDSAISAGLDFDADGQVRIFETMRSRIPMPHYCSYELPRPLYRQRRSSGASGVSHVFVCRRASRLPLSAKRERKQRAVATLHTIYRRQSNHRHSSRVLNYLRSTLLPEIKATHPQLELHLEIRITRHKSSRNHTLNVRSCCEGRDILGVHSDDSCTAVVTRTPGRLTPSCAPCASETICYKPVCRRHQ